VFNVFVHWLYTQEIPSDWEALLEIAASGNTLDESAWNEYSFGELLLKASVFGDRVLAPVLHRLAHNTFVDRYVPNSGQNCSVNYATVIWIYDNLPKGHMAMRLAVELQCIVWDTKHDDKAEELLWSKLPHEFLLAVMFRNNALKEQKCSDVEVKACAYHLHASEKEKKVCQKK